MRRVAIVHDWFTTLGGSERVVQQMLQVFPEADLFSLIDVLPAADRRLLGSRRVHTSFLQDAPLIGKYYRYYLPLMPMAIEGLDLRGYDLVISSCHAVSKGVRTSRDQLHISYIHTPMRYIWDMRSEYFGRSGPVALAARLALAPLRTWDQRAAQRPHRLIANSKFVAGRIRSFYDREAQVIYPPVDTRFFQHAGARENFYLTVSRLAPYKHVDMIARAFQAMPERRLVIIGDGEKAAKLRAVRAPNIEWLGHQTDEIVRSHMQRCRAFVFAAREDFGIAALEAQACGAPVIAFGEGGVAEAVRGLDTPRPTGVFFSEQSVAGVQAGVLEFERNENRITAAACRENAEGFQADRFRRELAAFVEATERSAL